MKNLILSSLVVLMGAASIAPAANAGSYYGDEDSSYTYRYKKHRHCYWKRVKWYDDYGYVHYKRVKICEY